MQDMLEGGHSLKLELVLVMTQLELKNIWQAPGYRELTLTLIDPATRKEYDFRVPPKDLQRLINECADAAKQIGEHPPIDWDRYPTQIYWPEITPWMAGPPLTIAIAYGDEARRS